MTLAGQLTLELMSIYRRAGEATGYWGNYFLRELRRNGGLDVARKLLRPHTGASAGFGRLAKAHRADLSVEAVVLQPRFARLFTATELAEARRRLDALPTTAFPTAIAPLDVNPETLDDETTYAAGAKKRVLVNAYERDPAARRACIRHHGARCKVCGFDFQVAYGEVGAGFIHVHHTRPLGLASSEYELDPRTDLVPVCPNCHAMLHTSSPPLGVRELQARLATPHVGRSRASRWRKSET
jgi:5-methylcytosine-specific restriction enzyme A